MRILSQEGLHEGIIDVPYEQVSIEQKENEIWCGYSSAMDRYCAGKSFAKYSTEAKARKAMEMLRVSFENYDWIKSTGNSEELKQVARMFNHDEFKKMTSSYFQFPSDDEVEA